MPVNDLYDLIESWLWLCGHLPFPDSADAAVMLFNESTLQAWRKEMLGRIARIDITVEIEDASARKEITEAVALAREGDVMKLQDIRDLLQKVLKRLAEERRLSASSGRWNQ